MASTDRPDRGLVVRPAGGETLDKVVPSAPGRLVAIDIDDAVKGLSEEDAAAVRKKYADGMVHLALKSQGVGVDGAELGEKLGRAVLAAQAADEKGLFVTETTTHEHGTGRTEFIVGNTATAERGKLNRGQRGEQDLTLWYVIIVAVAVLIGVALLT